MQDLTKGDLVIYEDENGKIEVFLYEETIWLPLNKIAELSVNRNIDYYNLDMIITVWI